MSNKVTIINYNTGNIYNIARAIVYAGGDPIITDDPAIILRSSRVILPGVGAFKYCMDQLRKKHLVPVLMEFLEKRRPLLGICVGMQMLLEGSTEFELTPGLDLISGHVDHIKAEGPQDFKTPVFGWYKIKATLSSETFINLEKYNEKYFYFVHSYRAFLKNKQHTFANYYVGEYEIPAVIGKDNIFGSQFHPEKSGKIGIELITDFLKS